MIRLQKRDIAPLQVKGMEEGWTCVEDSDLVPAPKPSGVFMLHLGDPLVLPHLPELKNRFEGLEVLAYLLVDGEFRGAVCGHWRIGPHDVEDIVVKLPAEKRRRREREIVREVSRFYHPPQHHILRYGGKKLNY